MKRLLRLWFSLDAPVSRLAYIASGLGLMAFKYVVESLVLRSCGHDWLPPWQFLDPALLHRAHWFASGPAWLPWAVVAWSLPFIWIGVVMSVRRARAVGTGAWLGLCFLLPYLGYVVMAMLAVLPDAQSPPVYRAKSPPPAFMTLALSMLAGLVTAFGMFAVSVYLLNSYGSALFVATPVIAAYVGGAVLNVRDRRSRTVTVTHGQATLVVSLMALLCFGLEGIACVIMAWPLAAILAWLGSSIAWLVHGQESPVSRVSNHSSLLLAVLALPLLAWSGAGRDEPLPLREVSTAVEVDAPPEVVWRSVVSFPDLPPPDGIFATGIACPLRATITGEGVGAIRRCEFTTGPFIEPITVWDQPRRLAFDVTAQPPTMREWSPYGDIRAPHLDGFLRSKRGEFRLIALPGGRTRLEGSTWYQLDIHPVGYWSLWADGFIHAIHRRVLQHIRTLAEASR